MARCRALICLTRFLNWNSLLQLSQSQRTRNFSGPWIPWTWRRWTKMSPPLISWPHDPTQWHLKISSNKRKSRWEQDIAVAPSVFGKHLKSSRTCSYFTSILSAKFQNGRTYWRWKLRMRCISASVTSLEEMLVCFVISGFVSCFFLLDALILDAWNRLPHRWLSVVL
jgi:hypothetical protein